jgi:hypothetical protein
VGFGTATALAFLVVAACGLLVEARRSRREIDRLSSSVERLRLLRRGLDGLHRAASVTRASTDITSDGFTQRAHR